MYFYESMKDINCAVLLSVLMTFNRWSKLSFNVYYDWSGLCILSSIYLCPLHFDSESICTEPGAWNSSRVKPSRVRLPPALQSVKLMLELVCTWTFAFFFWAAGTTRTRNRHHKPTTAETTRQSNAQPERDPQMVFLSLILSSPEKLPLGDRTLATETTPGSAALTASSGTFPPHSFELFNTPNASHFRVLKETNQQLHQQLRNVMFCHNSGKLRIIYTHYCPSCASAVGNIPHIVTLTAALLQTCTV